MLLCCGMSMDEYEQLSKHTNILFYCDKCKSRPCSDPVLPSSPYPQDIYKLVSTAQSLAKSVDVFPEDIKMIKPLIITG